MFRDAFLDVQERTVGATLSSTKLLAALPLQRDIFAVDMKRVAKRIVDEMQQVQCIPVHHRNEIAKPINVVSIAHMVNVCLHLLILTVAR